ncbi:UNVERIFIED_CONTAM: hypothetical protein Sindi_1556500 [Sesamum indicum]
MEEALGLHEETTENSQTKCIQDLSNRVYELGLKIEQLSNSSANSAMLPRIEFPRFSGEDFSGWIYKCDQFFQVYKNTPDELKVRLASIHMEGDALRWHKKYMKRQNPAPVWDEYVREMRTTFGVQGESTRPLVEMKRHRRRICRLQEMDDDGDDNEIYQLKEDHFRFGPIYARSEDKYYKYKLESWEHVQKNSDERPAVTIGIYTSAVRLIEEEAKSCYADDGVTKSLTGPQFREMMIEDGCFFLQLALYLLGGSQQLRYPADHDIFTKRSNPPRFRDVKNWIEAMFFVGNQIPLVVLKELIKQSYFEKVIKAGKWKQPSEFFRRALYELLLLPELEAQKSSASRAAKGIWGKVFASRIQWLWLQQQQPTDLLHGLQLLILGPELDPTEQKEEEEHEDLEAQYETADTSGAIDETTSSSATDLKQSGMHFWPSEGIGSRGICFTNTMFLCHGYPILHLPPILMEDDTELMFQSLRNYEISQKLGVRQREVCSYIRFMSELIPTPDDAKLIADKGVIQGNLKHKHKLPGILRGLASRDNYNQNLRVVKLKISDYSPPIWKKYWHIISLGLIITVLQTVYTILPYYKSS